MNKAAGIAHTKFEDNTKLGRTIHPLETGKALQSDLDRLDLQAKASCMMFSKARSCSSVTQTQCNTMGLGKIVLKVTWQRGI